MIIKKYISSSPCYKNQKNVGAQTHPRKAIVRTQSVLMPSPHSQPPNPEQSRLQTSIPIFFFSSLIKIIVSSSSTLIDSYDPKYRRWLRLYDNTNVYHLHNLDLRMLKTHGVRIHWFVMAYYDTNLYSPLVLIMQLLH